MSIGSEDDLTGRLAAEELLRTFHESQWTERQEVVFHLVHEDAEMRLLASNRELVHGREALARVLSQGKAARRFEARVTSCDWLDERTAIVSGQARFVLPDGGFADNEVYWLDELRDSLLWRVDVFFSEAEARQAYAAR